MKKIIICALIGLFIVALAGVVSALDDVAMPDNFYDGDTVLDATVAVEAAARLAADTAQIDTNATTTATGYTPRFVGDVLIGSAGSGTNAVFIAVGTTSNDWATVTVSE